MTIGFLTSKDIPDALKESYYQGDLTIGVQYLMAGLTIGPHRILIKQNFHTAAWVPPAGKRDSHTIYYGDCMLKKTLEFFVKTQNLKATPIQDLIDAEKLKRAEKAAKATPPVAPKPVGLIDGVRMYISAIRSECSMDQWLELLELCTKSVVAFGRHERQHARHTPQDLQSFSKVLKKFGIPFYIFNCFEDARIEEIGRREQEGLKFGWLTFELLGDPVIDPVSVFLRRVQLEGERDIEGLGSLDLDIADRTFEMEDFYQRACDAPSADHLIPIMKEFMEQYGKEIEDKEKSKSKSSSEGSESGVPGDGEGDGSEGEDNSEFELTANDLTLAAEASEKGDEFFDEFEKDAKVVGGTDAVGAEAEAKAKAARDKSLAPPKKDIGKGSGASTEIPEATTPEDMSNAATESDYIAKKMPKVDASYLARVDRLTDKLKQMFKAKQLTKYVESPNNRMSVRHLARGEFMYVKRDVRGGKQKRKYGIVVDCSGSMDGQPLMEGRVFLLALNNLAKSGHIEGDLILSGSGWVRYKLPVADSLIVKIAAGHGSEGLQRSLKGNINLLKKMDDVFVYTDASITDTPINREYFKANGITPVGLYAGSASCAPKMEQHFPQNIIRDNVEDIVEAMLIRNKRR